VREVVRRDGRYDVAAVLDDMPRNDLAGMWPVGGCATLPDLLARGIQRGVVAIGDNADRERVALAAAAAGLGFIVAIDPSAVIASNAVIGPGTVIMPTAVVQVGSRLGGHAIVNTGASVDHDCEVGDFAHLSPGVRISGECCIGAGSHLGIGASVTQCLTIGADAVVGAGAAVVDDVVAGSTVAGVPARAIGPRCPAGARGRADSAQLERSSSIAR
jgi:sugar O-acyltransferase (sialic acid O-acetyltransferase NeuD family)